MADPIDELLEELRIPIEKAKNGDQKALELLIEKMQNRIFRYLFFLCGSQELTQDLTQETFIKMIQSIHHLKEPQAFISWIYTIAKRTLISHKRKNWLSFLPLFDKETLELSNSDNETSELALSITQTLTSLNEKERDLIILVDIEGFSYVEACKVLGISMAALKSRIHRARQAFEVEWNRSK